MFPKSSSEKNGVSSDNRHTNLNTFCQSLKQLWDY